MYFLGSYRELSRRFSQRCRRVYMRGLGSLFACVGFSRNWMVVFLNARGDRVEVITAGQLFDEGSVRAFGQRRQRRGVVAGNALRHGDQGFDR